MHTREYVFLFCVSLFLCHLTFFLVRCSGIIIVSRDVLCYISIRVLELLHHQLISMHMGISIFGYSFFLILTEICFSTAVEDVGNSQNFHHARW